MATTINAAASAGLVTTADTSQILQLQTNGITGIQVDASQKVTFANSLTSPTLVTPVINGMGSSILTSGTAIASTSGTSIDFTGIPSWAKRISVMFNGVSTSGTSNYLIQIGNGSIVTSGYVSSSSVIGAATCLSSSYTTGFGIRASASAFLHSGAVVINNITGNTWVAQGSLSEVSSPATYICSGVLALVGTLDRIRLTTVNGTDTFDAGSINIMYE